MIRLFINAIAATAGGGLTYVRNVLPRLAAQDDVHTTLLVGGTLGAEIAESDRVTVLREDISGSSARRLWHEQRNLPGVIRRCGAEVLLSTGNFALYRSPVPQILLSRNALYISNDFVRDLRQRGDYRLWLDNEVKAVFARWSVGAADCTVAPSAIFARELKQWTGKDVVSIHHGFDHELFFADNSPLPAGVKAKLDAAEGSVRLLTLIRAIAILKRKLRPRTVRLILTCRLNSKDNPGEYRADTAAALVKQLDLDCEVVELGAIPYSLLHHLYRACDFYVTPAYAETFAHPLVEAMASGLPVIASDLAVHQEICGEAARYFPRFSPEGLSEAVIGALEPADQVTDMRQRGELRARHFSWDRHVRELLQLVQSLAGKRKASSGVLQLQG